MIQLRPYQSEAVAAVYDHLRQRDDNPCVVLPTAAGKSIVIAQMCGDAVGLWNGRVCVLSHVRELLEQTGEKLQSLAPSLPMGFYSAGMGRRDRLWPILLCQIQSVYRRASELGPFDLTIIDETHLVGESDEGMFRRFISESKIINPQMRVVGLTATPFRLKSGLICGPGRIFSEICYEVGVRELIVQGYLCPLKTKAGKRKIDTSNLHLRGGEFIAGEVEALMDDESLVRSACREIVEQTEDRHSVLIFAAGVKHALHVQQVLKTAGHECGFVCGETLPFERTETLQRFKEGQLKYLVNVNVLTTGFDAPNIDCVVLLRPTNSPGLYYQMVGRSFRLHPSKKDSLVLDYGGNVLRHGPVDALQVKDRTTGSGEAPAKECPQCQVVVHAAYSLCPECGHAFPSPDRQKHDHKASTVGVLSGEATETEYTVNEVCYSVHAKRDASEDHPKTMRVDYMTGYYQYKSEWVCFDHPRGSYARQKAEAWWKLRSNTPVPTNVADAVALAQAGALAPTQAITVRSVSGEKYDRIINYALGEKPSAVDYTPSDTYESDSASVPAYVPADDDIPF